MSFASNAHPLLDEHQSQHPAVTQRSQGDALKYEWIWSTVIWLFLVFNVLLLSNYPSDGLIVSFLCPVCLKKHSNFNKSLKSHLKRFQKGAWKRTLTAPQKIHLIRPEASLEVFSWNCKEVFGAGLKILIVPPKLKL